MTVGRFGLTPELRKEMHALLKEQEEVKARAHVQSAESPVTVKRLIKPYDRPFRKPGDWMIHVGTEKDNQNVGRYVRLLVRDERGHYRQVWVGEQHKSRGYLERMVQEVLKAMEMVVDDPLTANMELLKNRKLT